MACAVGGCLDRSTGIVRAPDVRHSFPAADHTEFIGRELARQQDAAPAAAYRAKRDFRRLTARVVPSAAPAVFINKSVTDG